MRILIVCPFFPPENVIAAIRIGKFAEHWAEAGHDVYVLARQAVTDGQAAPEHARLKVLRVPDPLARAARLSVDLSSTADRRSWRSGLSIRLKALVKRFAWPDVYGPWAMRAWRAIARVGWRPDVVVASTGPFSSLLLGAALARRFGSSLVVDYRDLLVTGPSYLHGRVRRAFDLKVEKKAASGAVLVSGVSQHMVDELENLHARPTTLVTNGFDAGEFEKYIYQPTSTSLRIVHCGTFYPGKRDVSPLFRALRRLIDSDGSISVHIDLYGRNVDDALESARSYGVHDFVRYYGQVSHEESLRIQAEADILLLVLWNDAREAGVMSGKLFEYIGARRPILMLGLETGEAANLIRGNGFGLASNDDVEISNYLRSAITQKRAMKRLDAPAGVDLSRFTRITQSTRFLSAIESKVGSDSRSRA